MSVKLITEHFEEVLENITALDNIQFKKVIQYIMVQIDKRFIDEMIFYVI